MSRNKARLVRAGPAYADPICLGPSPSGSGETAIFHAIGVVHVAGRAAAAQIIAGHLFQNGFGN